MYISDKLIFIITCLMVYNLWIVLWKNYQDRGSRMPRMLRTLKSTSCFIRWQYIPQNRVQRVSDFMKQCDSLLVRGSSLATESSCRIVEEINEAHKPVAMVNIGTTDVDDRLYLKIEAKTILVCTALMFL